MVLYLIQFNRTMVREETFLRKNPLYRDNDCRAKPVTLNSGHNEILFYILLVPYFYFTLIQSFQDRINECRRRFSVRDFGNCLSPVIPFLDFSPNFYRTATLSVIITGHIDKSARLKIREQFKRFIPQISYCSIQYLIKIMRQYL